MTEDPATIRIRREGRYDRQRLAGWSQRRLHRSRIVVVGAGALGNEVVKNLALVGVGALAVVDYDRVAPSNLARCVLFRDEDVGESKAEVVARRARDLNPDVSVVPLQGDLDTVLGDSYLYDADAVIGCVDNAVARFSLNRRVRRVHRGWIDGAMSEGSVQVTRYRADGPCYACVIGPRSRAEVVERFSCTGYRRVTSTSPVPTTAIMSALGGSLLAQLAIDQIHGRALRDAERWTVLLTGRRFVVDRLPEDPECPFHRSRLSRRPIRTDLSASSTWGEAARALGLTRQAVLELREDIVTGLRCSSCGAASEHLGPRAELLQEQALCSRCGLIMEPSIQRSVVASDGLSRVPLTQLGYADGDWLSVCDDGSRRLLALWTNRGWGSRGER